MHVRLLLGPAGSGKTWRCVAEVRSALRAGPDGPPLLFLAPKQATFQLERQLLADPALGGFTRLRILSFDRLAARVLHELGAPAPELLAEEGRLMVLRALLTTHRERLTIFRATARLTGFAAELSGLLREFQRHQVAPERLARLAAEPALDAALRGKLEDLARLLDAYLDWLARHGLQDADSLLDVAAAALKPTAGKPRPPLRFGGLWLDGFAEMTPQELDLLAAVLPACDRATLAFCLDSPVHDTGHWLSHWAPVRESFRRLRDRLAALPGCELEIETLPRAPARNRFAGAPPLQHLEAHWGAPLAFPAGPGRAVRVIACANPLQEVTVAAREILRFTREAGGRFRETAVLVRSLEGYHEPLRRVFRRYGIPFFLDRRESVAHHPLAELTRGALRTAVWGWQHADWFSALKSGLVHRDPAPLDRLENEALARGWRGRDWLEPLAIPDQPRLAARLETLRAQLVPPFARLARTLTEAPPSGPELADALRRFWNDLDVEAELARWADAAAEERAESAAAIHRTVWEQMLTWLDNVRLAFSHERLPAREWLPILEAGLANLSVGVVPPALDQVLVGAVDRSRNPDLRQVILLGLNEGVFPAPPAAPVLLTQTERSQLGALGLDLTADRRRLLGRERYFGYIACTRARERLVATFSRADAADRPLGPSAWVAWLQRLFPALEIETAREPAGPAEVIHASELLLTGLPSKRLATPAAQFLAQAAGWTSEQLAQWRVRGEPAAERLSPALAARLYGSPRLSTSVSRLEQFAACPFQFFVAAGLRADERQRFEVDARQRGSFQHEVLRRFHETAVAAGRRWRDFTPDEARDCIGRIARAVAEEFGGGLLQADEAGSLTARGLTRMLQDFVAALVTWMRRGYAFNPVAAELAFGGRDATLPAWVLPLAGGGQLAITGQVDRVDVAPALEPDVLWCVVHDYKSSEHRFDALLFRHGVQMQLPAYLAAVCALDRPGGLPALPPGGPAAGVRLRPAGLFYANLRGSFPAGKSRGEVLGQAAEQAASAYQHRGRFTTEALDVLDARPDGRPSGQFAYSLTQAGELSRRAGDALTPGEFAEIETRLRAKLVELAGRILAGEAAVDPYQKGARLRACDQCRFQTVCRIDPWTHRYRRLG